MISVLNTGVANVSSVLYAIERLGYKATLTDDPDQLVQSSQVILPGVGTARALFAKLQALELAECIKGLKQPVLGICLGMQALFTHSEEGDVPCLGILEGKILRLKPAENQTIPHMGWNQVRTRRESQLLKGIPEGSNFYFVHSYGARVDRTTVAFTEYGGEISAVVESSNWFGTQFHPERSGALGEKLIANFLKL